MSMTIAALEAKRDAIFAELEKLRKMPNSEYHQEFGMNIVQKRMALKDELKAVEAQINAQSVSLEDTGSDW